MTKATEHGENEITDEAKRLAGRSGDVCAILRRMLDEAKAAGELERAKKIEKAQKYLGCRNVRKRRKNP